MPASRFNKSKTSPRPLKGGEKLFFLFLPQSHQAATSALKSALLASIFSYHKSSFPIGNKVTKSSMLLILIITGNKLCPLNSRAKNREHCKQSTIWGNPIIPVGLINKGMRFTVQHYHMLYCYLSICLGLVAQPPPRNYWHNVPQHLAYLLKKKKIGSLFKDLQDTYLKKFITCTEFYIVQAALQRKHVYVLAEFAWRRNYLIRAAVLKHALVHKATE